MTTDWQRQGRASAGVAWAGYVCKGSCHPDATHAGWQGGRRTADAGLPFAYHVKGYANVMVKTGLKVS
ncbi:hypothetical protein X734_20075 [Mesorhizobium sp. L2C084A000]|nr:hypothetical protein X734_20075 [Mesorhizobium sp. L2C084A000]